MLFREPSWWYLSKPNWKSSILKPISYIWAVIASQRMRAGLRIKSPVPVICVGNFTAGGTGKTPLSIFLAQELKKREYNPVFLTRGYGSKANESLLVNKALHTAKQVGDEPLLLSEIAPVIVSGNRVKGINAILETKIDASVIIMDDGLQNSSVHKDCSIAIVDGHRGFGNKNVIPSGPLRAPLKVQFDFVDIIIVNGTDTERSKTTLELEISSYSKCPVFYAHTKPSSNTEWLKETRVYAYAGIANPIRFFKVLEKHGAHLLGVATFADHHIYTEKEALTLLKKAELMQCQLVTTEKDWVRLDQSSDALKNLKRASRIIPINLVFKKEEGSVLIEEIERKIFFRQGR